jgi:hypothetical protein
MAKTTPLHSTTLSWTRRIPSPALVAQEAVRRFPRWALLLLCALYVLAGFIGREPWKSADLAGFGLLFDLIGTSDSAWIVARIAAAALLALTLLTTWYATYYLARRDAAQPVPFAFGGEAKPTDYARAIADGAILALIACLGLAQLSHETTPALLQMALVGLIFFGVSSYRYHPVESTIALLVAIPSLLFELSTVPIDKSQGLTPAAWWHAIHLLAWFAWPAWALALLTLVKWRRHWLCSRPSSHIAIPMVIVCLHLLVLPFAIQQDRWFLSALPALACLAAFALPTLRRNMKSLIDLFTLLFFSGCALVIWIVWLAMQTGIPPKTAANVARLAPLFTPSLSIPALLLASGSTCVWVWLVTWRLGKHRPAIWMSMVLPAGGAALCWLLLMSLWLPLLDHARSYKPLMMQVQNATAPASAQSCIQTHDLSPAQLAALRYYLDRPLTEANRGTACNWLIAESSGQSNLPEYITLADWQLVTTLRRPTDDNEDWLIYQRRSITGSQPTH